MLEMLTALLDCARTSKAAGSSTDSVIEQIREASKAAIDGLRGEVIHDLMKRGPGDMKTLCERATTLGATLHSAQILPWLQIGISDGLIHVTEEPPPSGKGRKKMVFSLVEKKGDTND